MTSLLLGVQPTRGPVTMDGVTQILQAQTRFPTETAHQPREQSHVKASITRHERTTYNISHDFVLNRIPKDLKSWF